MSDTPAIAPCWWCGNPDTHVERFEGAAITHYVACMDGNCCYAQSPEAESEAAAIRVHNAGPRGGGK